VGKWRVKGVRKKGNCSFTGLDWLLGCRLLGCGMGVGWGDVS
jgi:hypothetical protein